MGDTVSGRERTRIVMRRVGSRTTRVRESEPERTPETEPRAETRPEPQSYRIFTDRVISDGWEYSGDGRRTIDFFKRNSNYDTLISGMTPEERSAFRSWTRGSYMHGEQYGGFENMSPEQQKETRAFDRILDRATLNTGITVRRLATAELVLGRGNRIPTSLAQLQALKGQVITSKGNMSTGAGAGGLNIGQRKSVEYVIKIPGGTTGAGMWIGDDRIHGWGARQREFMTNRDAKFAVGDTTFNRRRGVYEVELIYVGRDEHDYGRRRR